MYTKKHVEDVLAELSEREFDPPVEVGDVHDFGYSVDLFDPVSGQIITVCRPHRQDIGQSEICLTPTQAANAVAQARASRMNRDRQAGFVAPMNKADAEKNVQAAKDAAKKADDEHKAAVEKRDSGNPSDRAALDRVVEEKRVAKEHAESDYKAAQNAASRAVDGKRPLTADENAERNRAAGNPDKGAFGNDRNPVSPGADAGAYGNPNSRPQQGQNQNYDPNRSAGR